ncbi:hypothetical protein ACM42_16740 [Bradyrhizobium sp. CCBAU 25338]|nr:hypothetical protein [Bradyrhizobium sp. CCBAU 25338]
MNQPQNERNQDQRPLTVAHGRKLFDQSKAIADQLDRLSPLLGLLEPEASNADQDPISRTLKFLEALADHSQRQTDLLQEIDSKLEFLLANSSIGDR